MVSWINLFFFCCIFSSFVVEGTDKNSVSLTGFSKLHFPSKVLSSGSLTFDLLGQGPYLGTYDGRILRYSSLTKCFSDYSFASPNRTKECCDGTMPFRNSPTCGYTTGLTFDRLTNKLYACDAYVGLTEVSVLHGVLAGQVPAKTLVCNSGILPPFPYFTAVEYGQDGMVYFTEAVAIRDPRIKDLMIQSDASNGRLLRYDPRSKKTTTLMSKLALANGVATDAAASFVLVSESNKCRITRYWLKGEKKGCNDVFATFVGRPNKIQRNQDGDFWVAVNLFKSDSTVVPYSVKLSPSGKTLATQNLCNEFDNRKITLVVEHSGMLYVGAANTSFIGQYSIRRTL